MKEIILKSDSHRTRDGPFERIEISRTLGKILHDNAAYEALSKALSHAGRFGYVASFPQLLHARTISEDIDDPIWDLEFYGCSEENVGRTPQGNEVHVVVHGGGLINPRNIQETMDMDGDAYYCDPSVQGVYFSNDEWNGLLKGKLPDGTEIPVIPYDEFIYASRLPNHYAVISDLPLMRKTKSGYQTINELRNNPLLEVRAGGAENAGRYLGSSQKRSPPGKNKIGHWHCLEQACLDRPWGNLIYLDRRGWTEVGGDDEFAYYEISCGEHCMAEGRFVSVKIPHILLQ